MVSLSSSLLRGLCDGGGVSEEHADPVLPEGHRLGLLPDGLLLHVGPPAAPSPLVAAAAAVKDALPGAAAALPPVLKAVVARGDAAVGPRAVGAHQGRHGGGVVRGGQIIVVLLGNSKENISA